MLIRKLVRVGDPDPTEQFGIELRLRGPDCDVLPVGRLVGREERRNPPYFEILETST